jgi:hypothetical protein
MAGGGGGGGGGGQSMLGGLVSNLTSGTWQGIADPMGIISAVPPPAQQFPFDQTQGPPTMTPQDTDRLAFLKAFGVQG